MLWVSESDSSSATSPLLDYLIVLLYCTGMCGHLLPVTVQYDKSRPSNTPNYSLRREDSRRCSQRAIMSRRHVRLLNRHVRTMARPNYLTFFVLHFDTYQLWYVRGTDQLDICGPFNNKKSRVSDHNKIHVWEGGDEVKEVGLCSLLPSSLRSADCCSHNPARLPITANGKNSAMNEGVFRILGHTLPLSINAKHPILVGLLKCIKMNI